MKLDTAFEEVPDGEDLLYTIEYWDEEAIAERESIHTDREVAAFVHPRTATAARILESEDGTYSVQPTMGGYDNGDCIIQSGDPTTLVSGSSSVVMTGLESLSEARAVAYAWMRGWVMRNSTAHSNEGGVLDAERSDWAEPIN